jgi:tRNA(His) guanylyltransferase
MDATAIYLCQNIQGAKFAYTQSDEISIVLTDFDELESDAWFDYNVQKMVSIAASLATAKFNQLRSFRENNNPNYILAAFDARVFQVPNIDEMVNVMIWRQQDCTRNSVSMAAGAVYLHSEVDGKSGSEKQEMLFQKGINWNDYLPKYKRGVIIKKHQITIEGQNGEPVLRNKWLPAITPIFTEDKEFLYKLIPTIQI